MTEYKYIKHTTSENKEVHTIALNRPKKMNAVSPDSMAEIQKCIEQDVNPYTSGARVVIFIGEGRNFTAGLDLGGL